MKTSNYAIFLTIAVALACGSDSATAPRQAPEVRFITGDTITDTVGTVLPTPLVVEVHDSSGKAIPLGTLVRFAAVKTPIDTFTSMWVQAPGSSEFQIVVAEQCDASGRAAVYTKLGLRTGTGKIVISVPTYGIVDTARFTVKPGNAATVVILNHDTTLNIGEIYTVAGGTVDVYGNLRSDSVTWSVSGSGATRDSAGHVKATAVGLDTITVRSPGLNKQATTQLSVVPVGRLSAIDSSGQLVAFDLNGRSLDTLVKTLIYDPFGIHPTWMPGTDKVIYAAYSDAFEAFERLYTVNSVGDITAFFATSPLKITQQAQPTPSADGSWIYFAAIDTGCTDYCLHRARSDGSSVENLTHYIGTAYSVQPSPSPNGSKVAYVNAAQHVQVFDAVAHTISSWSVEGSSPAWSRDGNTIAYIDIFGRINAVKPDGTGGRTLTQDSLGFSSGDLLTWSPDSKWIVGSGNSLLKLVDAQTGVTIPLTYTAEMRFPSWK